MEKTLDLDIENYTLDDILNLFKIPKDFTEEDVAKAKKIVLKTHPDKSKLSPDYFRFYSKAYKKLYFVWKFRSTRSNSTRTYDEIVAEYENGTETVMGEHKKTVLDNFFKAEGEAEAVADKSNKFNKWFNEQFEKHRIEEDSGGYGDWLRSNEDLEVERRITHAQLGEEMEKKKQQVRSLVVHRDFDETYSNFSSGMSILTGDAPECFSSGLFSALQYEDLKKAHVESVIPVTMEDYANVPKFKNLEEYNHYRNSQQTTPLSEAQANEYLSKKSRDEQIQTTERAYKLAKQLEEANKKQTSFWSSLMKIEN
jgi:curved DNA-binding protein CbpA